MNCNCHVLTGWQWKSSGLSWC